MVLLTALPTINMVQNSQTGPPSQSWANFTSAVTTPPWLMVRPAGVPPDQALKTATFGLLTGPEAHVSYAYNQQWSFSLARQVGTTWVFEGQYLGSKATHLYNLFDYNATTAGTTALATRVPYPKWARIYGFSSGANLNYNALILSAERLSHGLMFKTAYTYSKALRVWWNFRLGNKRSRPESTRPYARKAGPTADHYLIVLSVRLPGSCPRSGTCNRRRCEWDCGPPDRGWAVNGIITAAQGLYFSPTVGTQNCNSGFQITCRPDLIANPMLGGSGVDTPRWTVNGFDWPNNTAKHPAQPPRFGTSGPNVIQGNGFQNVDFSIRKDIPVSERIRFEFRFESFNALNHTNFGQPTAAVDNPNFGRTFSACRRV